MNLTDADERKWNIDYFVDGHEALFNDIHGAPYTVVCNSEQLNCAVHAFGSRAAYVGFAAKGGRIGHYISASIGHEEVLKLRTEANEMVGHPVVSSKLLDGEVAKLMSKESSAVKAWARAVNGATLLEGPLLNSIVLHENRDLSGSFVYIPHWWATAEFGANHMNDKASCVTLAGSFATIWEHVWFQGRKLDCFVPFAVGFPLWRADFEDIASSARAWGFW